MAYTEDELQQILDEYGPYLMDGLNALREKDSTAYSVIQHSYGDYLLSDAEEKYVHKLASRGGPFDDDEMRFLIRMSGMQIDQDDDEEWSEDVLDKYAEHLRNYLYTYKDEARELDPSIDTSEKHIGIMAQDLEQVNPACVKEAANGTKVVDTARLALMNAGAIADLARDMKEVKAAIALLMERNNG